MCFVFFRSTGKHSTGSCHWQCSGTLASGLSALKVPADPRVLLGLTDRHPRNLSAMSDNDDDDFGSTLPATSRQVMLASKKSAQAEAAKAAEAKAKAPLSRDRKDAAAQKVLARDACWECKQSSISPSDSIVFCEYYPSESERLERLHFAFQTAYLGNLHSIITSSPHPPSSSPPPLSR